MIRYDHLENDILNLENEYLTLSGLSKTFQNISAKGQYRPRKATAKEMFAQAPDALDYIYKICKEDIKKYNFKRCEVFFFGTFAKNHKSTINGYIIITSKFSWI